MKDIRHRPCSSLGFERHEGYQFVAHPIAGVWQESRRPVPLERALLIADDGRDVSWMLHGSRQSDMSASFTIGISFHLLTEGMDARNS